MTNSNMWNIVSNSKNFRKKSRKFTNAFTNIPRKNHDNYKWPLQLCIKIIPLYKNSAKTVYFVHKFLLVIILAKFVHESFNHMIKYWFQYVMKITRC